MKALAILALCAGAFSASGCSAIRPVSQPQAQIHQIGPLNHPALGRVRSRYIGLQWHLDIGAK